MRRYIALALWAYFGWYAAAHVLSAAGGPTALAPLGGLLMGAIALRDLRPWIAAWHRVDPVTRTTVSE